VLRPPLDAKALVGLLAVRPAPRAAGGATTPTRRLLAPMSSARTPLIGDSPPMQRLRSIVERVAPTSATVLIEGETGTGKELVARLVHERSGRRGPFVPVNCGAIPSELMESELFGHARGAFTGAHQPREGLFLAARGGTLFLDEISEMRGDLQVKLLRALEESRIRPVGADREIPVDARIVASSQPGLRERVHQRLFREDLYFRLNVVHLLLPSLRERTEDLGALVQHFMQQVGDEFGLAPALFDATQLARLRHRAWPGNVRELRNFVERTVVMGEPPDDDPALAMPDDAAAPEGHYPVDWTLEQVKQAHIVRVLDQHRGNRTAAARQLGVSRRTLERRLGPGAEATVADD
jgi:DNA-binding NtrC family response regulator